MQAEATIPTTIDEDPLVGTVVGERYRVTGLIGRGGMGTVYLAEHLELDTLVALKVLTRDPHVAGEDVERFVREARAAVQLRHPNIVQVFDLGKLDDGTPFMAMERLQGRDLDDLIVDSGAFSMEDSLALLEPIAGAIDAVHAKGLVHRDIKPANVFLAQKDGRTVPILLDFGLAQLRDRAAEKRLTGTGLIVGTPHYLAPEVGLGKDPDERADQYSLAVIAYELLSGVLPFDGTFATAIMVAKAQEDPPALQMGGLAAPPAIDAVLRRALDRIPSSRFESCRAFTAALRAAAAGAPAPSRVAPAPSLALTGTEHPGADTIRNDEAPPDEPRSRRGLYLATLLVLLLIAGGVGVFVALRGGPEPVAETPAAPPEPAPEPVAEVPEPVAVEEPPVEDPPEELPTEPAAPEAPALAETGSPNRSAATRRVAPTTMAPSAMAVAATESAPDPGPVQEAERSLEELMGGAQSALLRGRLPTAARLFREATYVAPRHAAAWRGLGLAEERLGHSPEARRAYQRYLALAPSAGDAGAIRSRLDALP